MCELKIVPLIKLKKWAIMSYNWATNKKVIILGAFSGGTATTRPVPHPRGSDQLALPYTVEGKGLRNPHAKFDTFFINVTIVVKFDMFLYRYYGMHIE